MVAAEFESLPVRERLIVAGIHELNDHGIQDFSVRRIATECGVSCAAPYKHFKDRTEFIAAIIEYVNAIWTERQTLVVQKYPGQYRKQLVEISLEYIRFLVENSYFRSIIMFKDDEFDSRYRNLRTKMTFTSWSIVLKYCRQVNMPDDVRKRKLYVIRSLIYGAALMFDNGELEYNEKNMGYVAYVLDREFDLE